MNPSPKKYGEYLSDPGCGFVAMANTAAAFWQSRMTRAGAPARLPKLTDIRQLAKDIRNAATYPTADAAIGADLDTLGWAYLAAAYPGLAARALTPGGSFQSAVDRSAVAAQPGAGWRIRTDEDGGFTVENGCDANKTHAACAARFANTPNFGGWSPTDNTRS